MKKTTQSDNSIKTLEQLRQNLNRLYSEVKKADIQYNEVQVDQVDDLIKVVEPFEKEFNLILQNFRKEKNFLKSYPRTFKSLEEDLEYFGRHFEEVHLRSKNLSVLARVLIFHRMDDLYARIRGVKSQINIYLEIMKKTKSLHTRNNSK